MRKIVIEMTAYILLVSLTVCASFGVCAEAPSVVLTASKSEILPGEEIEFSVMINEEIVSRSVGVHYEFPDNVFELSQAEWDFEDFLMQGIDEANNRSALAFGPDDVQVSGKAFTLKLTARSNAKPGIYSVTDEFLSDDKSGKRSVFDLSASVAVSEPILYGDADNNGSVDGLDLIVFAKYNLALIDKTECALENMDVNCDGSVDGLDLIVMAKYNLDLIDSIPYKVNG